MATKEQVLEQVKALVKGAQELSKPNPFDQVGGIPEADSLKLNGQVISDGDLSKLLAEVEKAKTDGETWKKVAGTIGGLLGGLAKGVLSLLVLVAVGCSTPPPVIEAANVERKAIVAFKQDHDAIVSGYHGYLSQALEAQVRLIENYELKLKEANLQPADVNTLMEQGRKKREEIVVKLEEYRAKARTADKNFEIALRLHDMIVSFLQKPGLDAADVQSLMGQAFDLWEGIKK